jgi:small-conductance mechanosensitive channel
VLLHPWAAGIFASTALMAQRYTLTPPLWDVALWSLLAGSGALLATRVIGPRPLRAMVYFFAGVYPLFLLAEASRLPVPLFRLGLAGISAIGLVAFALLAMRSGGRPNTQARVRWSLGIGAAIWGVLLGAETFGFYMLARWLLHATVASALIVFTVGFLVVVARGAIRTMLRMEAKGRLRFLRNVGVPLAERLVVLFQAILIIWAGLAVLDAWELIGSPLESWNAVKDAGFTLAGISITVGRVLVAGIVVYLAMLGSWIARTFIRSEISPRWDLDRGVGESISTLLHYLLLTLGVLFALGALGVELQNFAIIAGALGVGIGFGLQNVVNNFVSGLILLFERPVRVGDIVVVGGEWGTIKKIGLRSTIVVTFDQSEMIVPNGDLVSEKVTNWTLSNPITRVVLPVGVAYGSDVQRVLQILREAAAAHPGVLAAPEPQALFAGFGDSALDFELRVWIRELMLRPEIKSTVLAEVDHRFRAAGIEIPFPQRDLHVRSVDSGVVEAMLRVRPARGDGESPPPR